MASIFDELNPDEFYEIMPVNLNEFINSKNRKKRDLEDDSYEFTFDHDNYNSDQNDHVIIKRKNSFNEDSDLVEKLSKLVV